MKPVIEHAVEHIEQLALRVRNGERRALAKALSILESTRPNDWDTQMHLLELLYPYSGKAWRVGITGPPGVGKSTLIEALGNVIVAAGHRLAVLAIDPAGARRGGSILGDKLRMTTLASNSSAFIRPSSNRGSNSAISTRLRESILTCEAAGYDVIIVETVGAGQSDVSIADATDMVIVVTIPNAGDEIQGIKRGVMECADLVLVNKSDLNVADTKRASALLNRALQLFPPRFPDWESQAVVISAITGEGIHQVWELCQAFFSVPRSSTIAQQRRLQRRVWFDATLMQRLIYHFQSHSELRHLLDTLRTAVEDGTLLPPRAATNALDTFTQRQ
ncbi:MAG: methylmalonyl Co-A mutase-associated GTPase MeaB [Chlorobi bacterium]|nr:methylmalonyl Co-A mutase-associated GTPase MeaB [Chlorobiota bacterium]